MKKILVIMLVGLVSLALLGCGGTEEGTDEPLKVSIVFAGTMMDGAWNQSGYDGVMMAEEKLGAEISYNENTKAADFENVIKNYAKDGADVVIGHSFEFYDAIKVVAKDYPDTVFLITSSDHTAKIADGNNIGSVLGNGVEQGFLQGATAAYVTKTNTVAAIGGVDIPAIKYGITGFKAGVAYVNETEGKDIKVLDAVTGSFDDLAKMKEQSLSMIGQGADVIMSVANIAGRGSYDAATEKGIFAVGSIGGTADFEKYPDSLLASGKVNMAQAIFNAIEKVQDGSWESKDYVNGINEDAVTLTFNTKLTDAKFPDLEKKVKDIETQIRDGKIVVNDYL